MRTTSKCDKYARLVSNLLKLLRLTSDARKRTFAKVYAELLVLRQVIRWQGLYSTLIDLQKGYPKNCRLTGLPDLLFSLLEAFGDILDRLAFLIPILLASASNRRMVPEESKTFISNAEGTIPSCTYALLRRWLPKIEQLEADCYFAECLIWLFHHLRTFRGAWKQGDCRQRLAKVLKVVKYACDSLTSYCKFSLRAKEIQPKVAAFLGIVSSIIGVYDLLK